MEKCCIKGCKGSVEIENQGFGLCWRHWSQYCDDNEYRMKIQLWVEKTNNGQKVLRDYSQRGLSQF